MRILNLDAFKQQTRSTSIFVHVSKVLSTKMEITISKEPLITNKFELCIFPKHIIRSTEGNQEKCLGPCLRIIRILTTTGGKKKSYFYF